MEGYNQAMEGETGLERGMWQLGLGGEPELYPERSDQPDCIYYLRTGFCGYGNRCRFNHPLDRSTAIGALNAQGVDYPQRPGQPVCQYYMRTGMCKFGGSCKYHHPKHGVGSSDPAQLNFYGYPLRPGERECLYYVKTGQCRFGVTCKFNHPQPTGIQEPMQLATGSTPAIYQTFQSPIQSSQQYGAIPANWSGANPAMLQGPYVPGSYGHMLLPSGVVPMSGWTPYTDYSAQQSFTLATSQNTQPMASASPTMYGVTQFSPSAIAHTAGQYIPITLTPPLSSSQTDHSLPERPGQTECQYYLRTGDCKFGSSCKYHHPPEWRVPNTHFLFSPIGLPLRPGAPLCSQYAQSGACKYGSNCKFDHSMSSFLSYTPSASSLNVGSTNATLAPSSSSSDLRPKGPSLLQISSMNTSSDSVGSTVQQSVQVLTSTSPGDGDIQPPS